MEALKSKKIWNRKNKRRLFIVLMLAYPVFHFLFFWVFVNINTIVMTFQTWKESTDFEDLGSSYYAFAGLLNYRVLFYSIAHDAKTREMIVNSLSYVVLNICIILPLSLVAAYVLFKKIPLSGFYRVMFFLPSIIPLAALVVCFKSMLDSQQGSLILLMKALGIPDPGFLSTTKMLQVTIWLFMIWSGMGYNIILFSSAMARMPMEVLESGKLEGVSSPRELVQIVVPLIWPNITTMVLLGLMSTFTVAMQPMMVSGNVNNTIGLYIYSNSLGSNAGLISAATLGLVCTIVAAPVVLVIRWLMERCFKDVTF